MSTPPPLPPDLPRRFTVGDALSRGVPPARLRRNDLESPFHGVRRTRSDMVLERREQLCELVLSLAARMTMYEFFSHVTAAVLWGLPIPPALLWREELDVAVLTPHRNPSGKGIRGHEVAGNLVHVVAHPEWGVPLASPASTWAMLGSEMRDMYDLVAAGDAVVRSPQHHEDPPALASLAQLEAAVRAGRRVGVGALREALPRVRNGASSSPETHLRLSLIDRGLPEPTLAHAVFDGTGGFIARVDMAYPELKIAIEYEGEHHLTDPAQWARDILRYEQLAAAGWHVVRVTKADLFEQPHTVAARVRVARALRSA